MSVNSEYSEDFEGQQYQDFSGDKEYLNSRGNSEAKNSETEVKTLKTPESRKKTPMGKFSEVNTSKFTPIEEDNTKPPKYHKINQSKYLNESEKTNENQQNNQKTDRQPQIIFEQQQKQNTFKYNQENSSSRSEDESSQGQQKKKKVEIDYQTYEKKESKTQDKLGVQKNLIVQSKTESVSARNINEDQNLLEDSKKSNKKNFGSKIDQRKELEMLRNENYELKEKLKLLNDELKDLYEKQQNKKPIKGLDQNEKVTEEILVNARKKQTQYENDYLLFKKR